MTKAAQTFLRTVFKGKENELSEEILSKYDWVDYFFYDDRARVQLNDKEGYIDTDGKTICPIMYDETDIFSEGLASVCIDGKWGFINKDGEEICPLIYDEIIHPFQDGVTVARLGEKLCVIDFRELK